jgi:predicted nucleic acid-binding protein
VNVLVDSDVLIEVARARDPHVVDSWLALGRSEYMVFCSPISIAELWHGARPNERKQIEAIFDTLVCIPADAAMGRLAGDLLNVYSKSHSLDIADALIAATAITHDASLWTRNRKHYPMKPLKFY